MKKIITPILCAALCFAQAAAPAQTLKVADMEISTLARMVGDGTTDEITVETGENAIFVNIAPEDKYAAQYFISLYDNTADAYVTPEAFTGAYENMIGPVEEGDFVFAGVKPGSYTVYVSSSDNPHKAVVTVRGGTYQFTGSGFDPADVQPAKGDAFPKGFMLGLGLGLMDDSTVTRRQMCMLVNNLFPAETKPVGVRYAGGRRFSDVMGDSSITNFQSHIELLADRRIVGGDGNGLFAPDDPVTIGCAVKMILAAAGYGPYAESLGEWPKGYMDCAAALGLAVDKAPDEQARWSDIADMLWSALDIPHMTVYEYNIGSGAKMHKSANLTFRSILTNSAQ